MRRPRYKLQVSTFPFLAVLLCAMGSLLLLLFIMDRRAKIAAQHMTDEVLEARKKRTKDEEDAHPGGMGQGEREAAPGLALAARDDLAVPKGCRSISAERTRQVAAAADALPGTEGPGEGRKPPRLREIQIQIAGRRAGLLDADKKETMSKKELIAAAPELARAGARVSADDAVQGAREAGPLARSLSTANAAIRARRSTSNASARASIFHPEERVLQGCDFSRTRYVRKSNAVAAR